MDDLEKLKEMEDKQVEFRSDGYVNMMNKYGSVQDTSEKYFYAQEWYIPYQELTEHYISDGLFSRIIDAPSEEVMKHEFSIGIEDESIKNMVFDVLEELDYKQKMITAIEWARLYGGAIIVMMIDDGQPLDKPVDWNRARGIDELLVFEKAVVVPDYESLYKDYGELSETGRVRKSKFGMPKWYDVYANGGAFRVHESRCLLFKNGEVPIIGINLEYRIWGIPELLRIRRELRDATLAHGYSVKMLERSVQAIYKMKDLANLLASDDGEDLVVKRMGVVDQSRGLFNSVAIDSEGEDYQFQQFTLNGVRETVETSCEMLSAVTKIPQTVLFGRSPSGMNSTGEGDMENYYNFIQHIQETMVKTNLNTLLDLIFQCAYNLGAFDKIPTYKLKFDSLWSLSEQEQAQVDSTKAQTEATKANTANAYVMMGALDPSEVREGLKKAGNYDIEDLVDEDSEPIMSPQERQQLEQYKFQTLTGGGQQGGMGGMPQGGMMPPDGQNPMAMAGGEGGGMEMPPPTEQAPEGENEPQKKDEDDVKGSSAVLVIKDGKVLCGIRSDNGQMCGGGGHKEGDESYEQCAARELWEEFGIQPNELIKLGTINVDPQYGKPVIYLCTDFNGNVQDTSESKNNGFYSIDQLKNLFPPFRESLNCLLKNNFEKISENFQNGLTNDGNCGIMNMDGNGFNENDHPRDEDGKFTSGGGSHKMSDAEREKYRARDKDKREKATKEASEAFKKKQKDYDLLAGMPAHEDKSKETSYRMIGDNIEVTRKTAMKNEAGDQKIYLYPCQYACIDVFAKGNEFRLAKDIAERHKKEGWKVEDLAHSKGFAMVSVAGKKPALLEVHVMYNAKTKQQFDWKLYDTPEARKYLGGK